MMDITIERACERLVLDFAHFSDRGDAEALGALFTIDGRMERPSGDVLVGRHAIVESYRSRPANRITRHVCTNVRIAVESAERARGLTYAVVYAANTNRPPEAHFGFHAEPRHLVGEFEDEFVKTQDGWRIAARLARFVMHVSAGV